LNEVKETKLVKKKGQSSQPKLGMK